MVRRTAQAEGFKDAEQRRAETQQPEALRIESRLQIRPCAEKHSTGTSGWLSHRADTVRLLQFFERCMSCMLRELF